MDVAPVMSALAHSIPLVQEILDLAKFLAGPSPITSSGLLFAFHEIGGRETATDHSTTFIAARINAALGDSPWEKKEQYLRERAVSQSNAPPQFPGTSPNVQRIFQRAQKLAADSTGKPEIQRRHLLAALLVPDGKPHGALLRLEELGLDLPALRRDYREFIRQEVSYDSPEAWDRFLTQEAGDSHLLPGYHSDQIDEQRDLLHIHHHVEAFAWLIAAKSVIPPLSIGLFGGWGTGKSFFIRSLRAEIARLTERARGSGKPQSALPLYKRIVQIEFNAWHYSESNLWASLVEHIFQNLKVLETDSDEVLEKQQKRLIDEMKLQRAAIDKAEKDVSTARDRLADAQVALTIVISGHRDKIAELEKKTNEDLWSVRELLDDDTKKAIGELATALKIDQLEGSAKDLNSALNQAGAILSRGKGLLTGLVHAKDSGRRLFWLVSVLVAASAVGLLVHLALRKAGLVADAVTFVASLSTGIGCAAQWVRKQSGWLDTMLKKAEKAKQLRDDRIAAARAKLDGEKLKIQQEIDLLSQKRLAAEQRKLDAVVKLRDLRQQLARLTPVQMLAEFIQDRTQSDDYRKHLGILALVRRDFEKLSQMIERENRELEQKSLEEEKQDEELAINRIVLYIDDLDRCPPAKVVEVLQAIHLLLAFPLFIVVVGVDVRWVWRALETEYRRMIRAPQNGEHSDRMTSPQEYIEKIFQIPFRLNALTNEAVSNMVWGLLESGLAPKTAAVSSTAPAPAPATPAAAVPRPGSVPTPVPRPLEIKFLEIQEEELNFLALAGPIFAKSPRSLKRYINLYKLVKAGLEPGERAAFVEQKTYRAVIVILGLMVSSPEQVRRLDAWIFRELNNSPQLSSMTLQQAVEMARSAEGFVASPVWEALGGFCAQPDVASIPLQSIRQWIRPLQPYAFPE